MSEGSIIRGRSGFWYVLVQSLKSISLYVKPKHSRNGMQVDVYGPDGIVYDTMSVVDGLPKLESRLIGKVELESDADATYRAFLLVCHIEAGFSNDEILSFLKDGCLLPGKEYRYRDSVEVAGRLDHSDDGWVLQTRTGSVIPMSNEEISQLLPLHSSRTWNDLSKLMERF